MRTHTPFITICRILLFGGLALVLFLSSCTLSLANIPGINVVTSTPSPAGPTPTPLPAAGINFTVALPAPLPAGEVLNLSVVDEITGLGLNPVNYPMQGMDSLHYSVNIPFPLNSIVKYRYVRQGHLPILEDSSSDKAVRYRLYYVTGPGSAEDVISSWADEPFTSPFGRVAGQILDSSNSSPVPDILVAVGGQQTLTDSNGRFSLENLPAGVHNLVAYAIDGSYVTLQQGAHVEVGKTTQVSLSMKAATLVPVTFTVSMPPNTIHNVPVRLAGNFYQWGNTFGDLQGGFSEVASRMPQLTPNPDGSYSLTIKLPAGADFRYKYTLGDGFWNAEHNSDGSFLVRQLIIPNVSGAIQIHDAVQTWQAGPASPILFEVTVPADTPVSDIPSIQFNPYGWTEPIPLWSRGNNQWVYELYSPLNMVGNFEYRYCRSDQCGVADDIQTRSGESGRLVTSTIAPQDLQDTVTGWTWFHASPPASQVGLPVTTRENGFWAGVEFLPQSDPTWLAWMGLAVQNVQSLYANWLVLQPTWTVSRSNPLVFSQVPGSDALWPDYQSTINLAHAANLNVALFPGANFPTDVSAWWKAAPRTQEWWNSWYANYSEFIEDQSDLATRTGAKALILGGDWIAPALPGGVLADGTSANTPPDASTHWDALILQVRQRFSGQVLWATSYPGNLQALPTFAYALDGVYLLWHAPLSNSSPDAIFASAGQLLDTDIKPFQADLGKPVILAAAYSSSDGAASISDPLGAILQPGNSQLIVNLQAQADIYQALLRAVNDRPWLGGFVSRGYYPPVGLQDASASIHGKPAADVLWYWYPRLLGIPH